MQTSHKSSLFLMELIFCIFFFSLASAVCMRLFARAHILQSDTEALNHGVYLTQSAAEAFKSTGGDLAALSSFFPEGHLEETEAIFTVWYQEDWSPLSGENSEASPASGKNSPPQEAVYCLTIDASACTANESLAGGLRTAQVTLLSLHGETGEAETILTLPAAVQLPRTAPSR